MIEALALVELNQLRATENWDELARHEGLYLLPDLAVELASGTYKPKYTEKMGKALRCNPGLAKMPKTAKILATTEKLLKTGLTQRIKIADENFDFLYAALEFVQHRCSVNTIGVRGLLNLANTAEKRLEELGLPKSARAGAKFEYHDSGPSANAYKYAQGATMVTIDRGTSAWYLTDVRRVEVYPRQSGLAKITLSKAQDELCVSKFRSQYSVVQNEIRAE